MTYNFKLYLLVATLSGFLLFSCGDDKDDEDPIVGTWESTTFSQTECEDPVQNISDFPCGNCFNNVFRNDGTFTSTINVPGVLNESISGIYTIDGNTLTTCDSDGANCETSSFTLSGNNLTVVGQESGCTLTINFERS